MTTLIALETSTEYCSVALRHGSLVLARNVHAGQSHSARVLPMVGELLGEAGITLSACDAVVFGAGPGSFTGLRIACSVAQGLAFGADLPVIPIGALHTLAEQTRLSAPGLAAGDLVLTALDARMGEVYWSLMKWDGASWHEQIAPSLDQPATLYSALVERCRDRNVVGCGNGFHIFATSLVPLTHRVVAEVLVPDAAAMLELAAQRLMRGELLPAAQAAPLYVRNRVAWTTNERELLESEKKQGPPALALEPASHS